MLVKQSLLRIVDDSSLVHFILLKRILLGILLELGAFKAPLTKLPRVVFKKFSYLFQCNSDAIARLFTATPWLHSRELGVHVHDRLLSRVSRTKIILSRMYMTIVSNENEGIVQGCETSRCVIIVYG